MKIITRPKNFTIDLNKMTERKISFKEFHQNAIYFKKMFGEDESISIILMKYPSSIPYFLANHNEYNWEEALEN